MKADEAAPHVAALLPTADPEMKLVLIACLARLDEPGQAQGGEVVDAVAQEGCKLGLRGQDTSELAFEDCRLPADALLGKEGGMADALRRAGGSRASTRAFAPT